METGIGTSVTALNYMCPKLQNISEGNIMYFPRMHSPCKLKKKTNPKPTYLTVTAFLR